MPRNLDESGRITWVSKVKKLLYRYGFGYIWSTENVGDVSLFIKKIETKTDRLQ